jgi:hypothetical protein
MAIVRRSLGLRPLLFAFPGLTIGFAAIVSVWMAKSRVEAALTWFWRWTLDPESELLRALD